MIFEHAVLPIQPGREAEFEAAFATARAIFARAEGCHGAELRRGIEEPSTYVLLVGWDTVEAHTVGFRESPLFGEWRAIAGGFFATPPTVAHYQPV
jgi:heme-degrading monooxygenase HmoA